MAEKFELTNESIIHKGNKLHRIRALKSFGRIKEGDLGGFVQSENNLSDKGDAWIYHDAKVYDDAIVSGNASVLNNAEIFESSYIYGDAIIGKNAKTYGSAAITGSAFVGGNAEVYGCADIYDSTKILNNARICGRVCIEGDCRIKDNAKVCGDAHISGCTIYGDALIDGKVYIDSSDAYFGSNAIISSEKDFVAINILTSESQRYTFYKNNNIYYVSVYDEEYLLDDFMKFIKNEYGELSIDYLILKNLENIVKMKI